MILNFSSIINAFSYCFKCLVLCCLAGALQAQNEGEEARLSPELRAYLTEHQLWDSWRANRARFACPKTLRLRQLPPLRAEDSIALRKIIPTMQPLPYTQLPPEALWYGLRERAAWYAQKHQQNPLFFEQANLNVLRIFERFPPALQQRIPLIATDITASMSPYAEQVLLLMQLALLKQYSYFLFFNDGDMLPEEEKVIGATGGLYRAEGTLDSLPFIIEQMQRGMRAGQGGATPENNLEAVLALQEQWDSTRHEIILIADAHSPVRDLALIHELRAPVRVILCGIDDIYGKRTPSSEQKEILVLLDYLAIAYVTGGSVHTLHEDMWDVKPITEGKIVYIDAKPHLMEQGQLKKITKAEADMRLNYRKH